MSLLLHACHTESAMHTIEHPHQATAR
jgi:hypothetical protein